MHRLPRQIIHLRSVARVGRVQRHLLSPRPVSLTLGRHYSSKNGSKSVQEKFDKILGSVRPDLKATELAERLSALLVLSEGDEKLTSVAQRTMAPLLIDENVDTRAVINDMLDKYLENPPEDNFDELVAHIESIPPTSKPDETLFDKLSNHLDSSDVKAAVLSLEPHDRRLFLDALDEVEQNPDNLKSYVRITSFLKAAGVPITYGPDGSHPLDTGAVSDIPDWMKEACESISEHEKEFAAEHPELAAEEMAEAERSTENFAAEEAEQTAVEKKSDAPYPYPNLMVSDPLLDSRDVLELPPDGKTQIYHNRVVIRNHNSIFHEAMAEQGFDFDDPDLMDSYTPTKTDITEESASSSENLPLSPQQLSSFYSFPLVRRRVTHQTGKGKIPRQFCLMVVGNGNGLVGLGQGKDEDAPRAKSKAFAQAVRNMDWVERFEKRTIWTDMETKLGSTQLLLRPRPVGFGLRCNPNLHQVLKAAGIKDISAKVWGSRNPVNVIKAAFRLLQAGHAPLAMGDGIGGRGRKLNKGSGLRSKDDMERERGRQLISLRK